jgi:hypothetical protein
MKKYTLVAIIILGMFYSISAKDQNPVSILSTSCSILYLKFNKSMYGAKLEIKNDRDSIVVSEVVNSRKVIIDFYYKDPGKYQITITKDDLLQSFSYVSLDDIKK